MEDNPNGQLSKIKMMEMYNGVLSVSKATKFVEEIFIKFDRDNNGHIDFKVVFHIRFTYCLVQPWLAVCICEDLYLSRSLKLFKSSLAWRRLSRLVQFYRTKH